MPYKAILFDLDGTLIDSSDDLGSAVNRILSRKGFPTHNLEVYRSFLGEGSVMLISRSLPADKRNDIVIKTCHKEFIEDYRQNYNVKTALYDGIPEMLDAFTEQRLQMAILSNKSQEFTEKCVAEFLSKWKFEVVLGLSDAVPQKPDPTGAFKIANQLNIPPSDFIYIGDTAVDLKTAIAADMLPVGVLWGFRDKKELEDNGARFIVDKPLQILDILKEEESAPESRS